MRTLITKEEWEAIQTTLAKAGVGYTVSFDNHHGSIEKIIEIEPFGIYNYIPTEEENAFGEKPSDCPKDKFRY